MKRGFSLLEVMVAASLLSIVGALLFAGSKTLAKANSAN